MIAALRFEWTRLLTLRSTYWLTIVSVLLSAAVAGLMAQFVPEDQIERSAGILLMGGTGFSPVPFVAMFMALLGIFAFGHEYRHGLVLPTLTAVPRRSLLVIAKLIVMTLWATLVAVFSLALNWVLAAVISGEQIEISGSSVGMEAIYGYVGYVVLWCLLGLGLAALLRGVPGAIVVIFVVPLLVEPVLTVLGSLIEQLEWLGDLMQYAPFNSGSRMYLTPWLEDLTGGGGAMMGAGAADPNLPDRVASSLTFGLWVAVIIAAGWVLFQTRDA